MGLKQKYYFSAVLLVAVGNIAHLFYCCVYTDLQPVIYVTLRWACCYINTLFYFYYLSLFFILFHHVTCSHLWLSYLIWPCFSPTSQCIILSNRCAHISSLYLYVFRVVMSLFLFSSNQSILYPLLFLEYTAIQGRPLTAINWWVFSSLHLAVVFCYLLQTKFECLWFAFDSNHFKDVTLSLITSNGLVLNKYRFSFISCSIFAKLKFCWYVSV